MNVRVFMLHHAVPTRPVNNGLFQTLVTRHHGSADGTWLGDLDGPNQADRLTHSELNHFYHVQHTCAAQLDYVGFEHYRRLLFLDPLSGEALLARSPVLHGVRARFLSDPRHAVQRLDVETFSQYLDIRERLEAIELDRLARWIASYDIILPLGSEEMWMDEHWAGCHPREHWPVIIEAMTSLPYFRHNVRQFTDRIRQPSFNNIFIMRTDLFLQYMAVIDETLALIESKVPPAPRYYGMVSERVLNMWVMQKRMENPLLRVIRWPWLFCPEMFVPAK